MDEAWRFLKNAAIKDYLTEALKTWRKLNAAVMLATQSSDDLERSDVPACRRRELLGEVLLGESRM